jgi:hypothetical protein
MNDRDTRSPLQRKLEALRSDFAAVSGRPFLHFYCPLLLADDPAEICRAHLVNQAFPNTSRRWTVQRTDVDNFYGTFFEADFVELKKDGSPIETSIASGLSGRLRPEISHCGQKVEFYKPTSTVPSRHSEVLLQAPSGSIRLALKIDPEAILETRDQDWQISIEKDCRLAALVSLLKAAHLTLFEMLGYRYAFSAGGMFLGKTVLGNFFSENRGLGQEEVLRNAKTHFEEFKNLVRPVLAPNTTIEDTVNDRIVYICEGSCRWAFLVFIRTAGLAHAVIVPHMESPDAAGRFLNFLKESGSKFQARRCHYNENAFNAELDTRTFIWPKVTLD